MTPSDPITAAPEVKDPSLRDLAALGNACDRLVSLLAKREQRLQPRPWCVRRVR